MESNSVCNHTGRESFMTSMITDQIWRYEVPLPINQNYIKICDIFSFFKIKTEVFLFLFLLSNARVQWCVLSNYLAKGKIMEICQRASQVNPKYRYDYSSKSKESFLFQKQRNATPVTVNYRQELFWIF